MVWNPTSQRLHGKRRSPSSKTNNCRFSRSDNNYKTSDRQRSKHGSAMADPLTTTLVLMYFVTPPAKLLPGETKEIFEARVPWTLQSTDHIETQDSIHCVTYA